MFNKARFLRPTSILLLGVLASVVFSADKMKPSADLSAALADIEKTLGFVPEFLKAFPEEALPGVWDEMKGLQMNPKTALPNKIKELIGLGVSAQIPCRYCIEGHTQFAEMNGATPAEIGEAVAMSGLTRHWSTFINGIQTDEGKFRMELQMSLDRMQMTSAADMAKMKPIKVTDAKSAMAEATQMMGTPPEFIKKFPEVGFKGAWLTERDLEMNPGTALSPKYKSLISLAVSAQIPCRYCIIADVEFAKAAGATETEINEALAMASFTREMSTLLNGMQVSETKFLADLARLSKGPKETSSAAGSKMEKEKMRTP